VTGNSKAGIAVLGDYTTPTTTAGRIAVLQALIPNLPDAPSGSSSSGAIAGGGYLDEMSAGAAIQLQVELDAIAALSTSASGEYTVTAGDATNTYVDIPTGLATFTLAKSAWTVRRAGSVTANDLAATQAVAGTLHLAHVSTYTVTAGDIIAWRVSV
jgi:hypothetical protein